MTSRYVSLKEPACALRLKELLGANKVRRLRAGQHPLAAGFHALEKHLAARRITRQERIEAANLLLDAQLTWELRSQWERYQEHFVKDLLKASECRAIILELQVMRFALSGRVASFHWERYETGKPDIRTRGPDTEVECKLIRSADLSRIFDKLKEAKDQHGPRDIPFVVAVGFEDQLDEERAGQIVALCAGRSEWFKAHPEVSALLVFTPHPVVSGRFVIWGRRATMIRYGAMTEVINHLANKPLPPGFTFKR